MALQFDPLLSGFRDDPYPHYARLRAENPVHWSDAVQAWVVSRHADVVAALRDPRLSAAARVRFALDWLGDEGRADLPNVLRIVPRTLACLDPPAHTRMRRLVTAAFRPRLVQAMRPRIRAIVDELLDRVRDAGRMDLVRDLAYPLPLFVGMEVLGLPAADRQRLLDWTDHFWSPLTGQAFSSVEGRRSMDAGIAEMARYLGAAIAARRREPAHDALSELLAAGEDDDHLSGDELIAAGSMVLLGGHVNVRYLISLGMWLLLGHPDLHERLRATPALVPAFVEEVLRFDGVAQILTRIAVEEVELDGRSIGKGERVLLLLASANRDAAAFACPDRLDIDRHQDHHIAFGAGAHFCPGAPLARLTAEIALTGLLTRLPRLRLLDTTPDWVDDPSERGLRSLHMGMMNGF